MRLPLKIVLSGDRTVASALCFCMWSCACACYAVVRELICVLVNSAAFLAPVAIGTATISTACVGYLRPFIFGTHVHLVHASVRISESANTIGITLPYSAGTYILKIMVLLLLHSNFPLLPLTNYSSCQYTAFCIFLG